MVNPFIGEVIMFGGNFAPRGWAFCDGQLLAISSNTALFSILGTTYGGDGRTTFALPDLRGRVVKGPRNGPGLNDYRLGQKGGREEVTLTLSTMPNHSHFLSSTLTVRADAGTGATTDDPTNAFIANDGNFQFNPMPDALMAPLGGAVSAVSTGGGKPFDHRNPTQAVNYIIAMFGIYPSRS